MSKLESNLILFSVTFFWGIQYIFLKNIPEEISVFAFLALTNGIGFVMILAAFFRELPKLNFKTLKKSALLAVLIFTMNALLTIGSRSLDVSVTSFFSTAYIVFIPIILVLFKKKVSRENLMGIGVVVLGLLFATGPSMSNGLQPGILLVLGACVAFAAYIVVLEQVAGNTSPVLLSMWQMFFCMLFSLVGWVIAQPETITNLPGDGAFWISVLVIALFVRGFTTIMQVYAQRYVSAINASLIYSTEIVFSLLTSMFLPAMIGGETEMLTLPKVIGCILIVGGVLVSDGTLSPKMLKKKGGDAHADP